MSKSVLSAKSTKLVEDLIATLSLKSNAKFYNQDQVYSENSCGTEGCLAGWIHFMVKGPEIHKLCVKYDLDEEVFDVARGSLTLKDGSKADTYSLFGTADAWPSQFSDDYYEASSNIERAKVGVARLRYFMETGE